LPAEHTHETDPTPAAARLHEVAAGVFAWVQPDGSWWVNNAGAVTGTGGTIVVDTCATEERTRRFLTAVAAVSDGAVTLAVNTHAHGDHTYGNSLLPGSTVLIGHERMRETLLHDRVIERCPPAWSPVPDWGAVTRRVPDVTTQGDVVLHTGSRRVELRHPGFVAHTDGDLVAWLPEERVLFSGDLLFHGLTPLAFQGSVVGARRSLEWIASFEPLTVVPGHGPLVRAADLPDVLAQHDRYYELILRTARDGLAASRSPLDAARECDLGAFAQWVDAERLVLNLHRAYAELDGHEMDINQAFVDAMAWNGGPLTTHVCCTAS
jgi:cyclase